MKRVMLCYLPGAGDRLVREGMPWLATKPQRPLRVAFPALPSVLQATLESGQPAAVHGVFGAKRLADGGDVEMCEKWCMGLEEFFGRPKSDLAYVRDDRLLRALARGHEAVLEFCTDLGDELRRASEEDDELTIVLIGGPSPLHCSYRLDPAAFVPSETASCVDGSLLRIDATMSSYQRSRAIMETGIERVLQGEGRLRRGCDHPEAGEAIVVAESGWSFEADERFVFGSADGGIFGEAFVAVYGGALEETANAWPNTIDDLRIAPTLASYLGFATDGFAEKNV